MAPSFLRSKRSRPQSQSPSNPNHKAVRPSLSLPDLTAPLLDISSWEEVPPFKFKNKSNPSSDLDLSPISPITPNSQEQPKTKMSMSNGGRNKKPILIPSGKETQFHRPFTPKLIINEFGFDSTIGTTNNFDFSSYGTRNDQNDFRKSKIGWSSDHPFSQAHLYQPQNQNQNQNYSQNRPISSWDRPISNGSQEGSNPRDSLHRVISRRKGRKKGTVGKLNIVVVGGKSVGKTSFINLLLSSLSTPEHPTPIIPSRSTHKPQSYTAISTISERLLVRVIDTPGLDLTVNDELSNKSRGRGISGLINLIEDRFEVMCQEEKKIRRMTGGEDGLIHLVIYLLDARQILHPQPTKSVDVDWSCIGLFDDDSPSPQPSLKGKSNTDGEAKISEVEIDIIRKLSKRSNVLPILTHSDSLTISEMNIVKAAVRRDLGDEYSDIPGKGFGIFHDIDDTSRKSFDSLHDEQQVKDERPPTPDSSSHKSSSGPDGASEMPYTIFAPDYSSTPLNANSIVKAESSFEGDMGNRTYKWGEASISNSNHCDFTSLKENILGENSKILRNNTREVLYENYRTERLLAKSGLKLKIEERERQLKEIQKVLV